MTEARILAESTRASVVAGAGCGKTHRIAESVALGSAGRDLILTHTHAGVDAIRGHLRKMGANPSRFRVETIAGFSLMYSATFPMLSGLNDSQPVGDEWDDVYASASRLFRCRTIQEILRTSYVGLYVDEYQDCTLGQHEVILRLAETLPCRVLGDPLQGIFAFRSELVSWDRDVVTNFEPLVEMTHPWRWKDKNPELGGWLVQVRESLKTGQPLDLLGAPVSWVRTSESSGTFAERTNLCLDAARRLDGTIVVVLKWPQQCHALARCLNGAYSCIEPFDCDDLMSFARRIQEAEGCGRAVELLEFASKCKTGLGSRFSSARKAFESGRLPRPRQHNEVIRDLIEVATSSTLSAASRFLTKIAVLPGTLYRPELLHEMQRALREHETGQHKSLEDSAWTVRDRTRHVGRRPYRRIVARTHLIKGLEFDHAIIVDAQDLDDKNLYVALTRASRSLTVCSPSRFLEPVRT